MSLLLETIRVADGIPQNLGYHQRRVDRSRAALFSSDGRLDLSALRILRDLPAGIFRWRIIYGADIHEMTAEQYHPKKISSVKTFHDDKIDYTFKYADRMIFSEMLDKKGDCDDILIIRNGLITDMSYANVAFFDGTQWLTPRIPLLAGTCRERLLETGSIREADIAISDLDRFSTVSVINAMLDLGEMTFPVSGIIP